MDDVEISTNALTLGIEMLASKIFDLYTWKARFLPGLLTIFAPFVALCVLLGLSLEPLISMVGGAAVLAGSSLALAGFARHAGSTAQERLWRKWGGNPSVTLLTRGCAGLDDLTRSRYMAILESRVQGLKFPSADAEEETKDGDRAAQHAAVQWLVEHTRDAKKFPLLRGELVSYGFHRNLYGLKPWAIGLHGILILGLAGLFYLQPGIPIDIAQNQVGWSLLMLGVSLVGWVFLASEGSVRRTSEGYARRLLAACEKIGSTPPQEG